MCFSSAQPVCILRRKLRARTYRISKGLVYVYGAGPYMQNFIDFHAFFRDPAMKDTGRFLRVFSCSKKDPELPKLQQ
jgi:hypothetical protein